MGSRVDPDYSLHIVAIPFPGRGHVNPMFNLCKIIATIRPEFLITFVVTEEWLGFLSSEAKPLNVRLRAIPNVIPSELIRANDYSAFLRAVLTNMEAAVDFLLDGLEEPPPPGVIISDAVLPWAVGLGKRRNIPVASLWTQSATVYSIWNHYQLLCINGHFDANLSEKAEELIDYIPGVAPIKVKDLPPVFHGKGPFQKMRSTIIQNLPTMLEAQYLLFTSIANLESTVIESLQASLQIPIYSIGSAIPHSSSTQPNGSTDYLAWLDAQPESSVLYISQGSFLSLSDEQMDEIIAGVHDSGVRYLLVARERTECFVGGGDEKRGIVVKWCEQMRVLCHPSVGGFWSHCGWNSVKEGAFAGVPFLTFPIAFDQFPNSKQIVDDWKIGWSVKKGFDGVVTRGEIAQLLRRFMDIDECEGIRRRAKQIGEMCRQSIEGKSANENNLEKFIEDVSRNCINR